ncbi:MAG: sigma-54-dependent Fis family transcriptional regulator [Acidobacteria bacterium]|nr:sigma-54-dependent Fis family transcriptional regulator [Acidobacteriota bacterium]
MADAGSVRILVVEDDKALSEVVCDELRGRGHMAVAAETVADGVEHLKQSDFDVALVDLMLPDGSGIDLLRQIAEEDLPTESIVLTGYAAVSTAIEAMKLGAYDYITKPARMEEIEALVAKAAEKARLRRENVSLKVRLQRQDSLQGIITEDAAMKDLIATLQRVAPSDLPVLVQGESGTGKELVAAALHRMSPRAAQPFVALNCGAVPETLLESELFGHEKGAFTGALIRKPGLFEVADKGVLFLDEVGEIVPAVQVKLLRAIETKEFFRVGGTRPVRTDVRIVSATNKNLKNEMQQGRFREDLYYRLNGVTLKLPPLRERKEDVALLARHFVDRFAPKKKLTGAAVEALGRYSWPGNVRELQMVIHRAAILCGRDVIDAPDLPLDVGEQGWKAAAVRTGLTLAGMEREYIQTVLAEHDGHRGKTARALGIDPKTLYNKLGPERPRKK